MIKLDVQYLADEDIIPYAIDFLEKYNSKDKIPVPIEEIIEFDFNIDIIPLPGIKKLCDVDGFISNDFTAIYVDQFVYENNQYRYRFTLAHEIGHLIMHKEKLSEIKLDQNDVINSWIYFNNELSNADHSKLEYQGYTFGGLALVPPKNLLNEFSPALSQVNQLITDAKTKEIARKYYLEYAIDNISTTLSPIFDVSTDVMTRRIRFDGLDKYIP